MSGPPLEPGDRPEGLEGCVYLPAPVDEVLADVLGSGDRPGRGRMGCGEGSGDGV